MVEITRLYSLHMFRSDAKSVFYVYVDVKDEDLFFYKNKKIGNIGLSKAIEQWFKEEGIPLRVHIEEDMQRHNNSLCRRIAFFDVTERDLMKFKLSWQS